MTHVLEDLTIVRSEDIVEVFSIIVRGKSHKIPVVLMKWRDDQVPEFCPVRQLLSWLSIKINRSGYWLPSLSLLMKLCHLRSGRRMEMFIAIYSWRQYFNSLRIFVISLFHVMLNSLLILCAKQPINHVWTQTSCYQSSSQNLK